MNEETALAFLGLTRAEAALYLKLLSMGEATASQLSHKTGMNRTFAYDRLHKLAGMGLVSSIVKEHRNYFMAAEPSQFLHLLKERETQLQAILPKLEGLRAPPQPSPRVTVYSSKKGVQTALNLILKEQGPVLVHGTLLGFQKAMGEQFRIWNKRRVQQRIPLRILTPENVPLKQAELRMLPEEEKTATTTFTFGNSVAIAFWSDVPVAILIQSREIAKEHAAFFHAVWNREVRIYSGVDGIVQAFYELIQRKGSSFLGVGYSRALAQVYGTRISDEWHKERLRNKVAARLISYDDAQSKEYFTARMKQWSRFRARFLDRALCGPACVTVSEDLIATFVYTEGSFKVVVNRNKETIRAYRRHFEQLWRRAKQA